MTEETKEIERKYLLEDREKIERLKHNSIKKIGIIQWYEETENPQKRIRLTISYDEVIGHTHVWEKATKTLTDNPEKRFETKDFLDPRKDINLSDLEKKKNVVKIRYIIKENPEIFLDEFLEIDNKDILKNDDPGLYYLEIETKEDKDDSYFENELKGIGLEITDVKDLTKEKSYQNFYKAKKREIKPLKIIEYVQNRLIGPVTVIMTQGQGAGKDKNFNVRLEELTKSNKYREFIGEIDALYLFIKSGFEVEKVHFLVFPSFEKGKDYPHDYTLLKEAVNRIFGLECSYSPINYDSSSQDSAYKSLREIFDVISKVADDNKDGRNTLIDLTGGQKYPGIELAIYSLFNKKAFYYKQKNEITDGISEQKMVQLKFPPLPIGWNNETIDDYSPYFDLISSKVQNGEIINYNIFVILPEFLKELFSISPEGQLITVPILNEIKANYDNARKLPFGHGKNFIDLIRDDKMINFVNEKIPIWSLRWIGDLIPETVEHSQRHSKRLMEFGFNLVRIMGEENFLNGVNPDLRKEFYFILAVAMNIHDLGHTVLNYTTDNGIEFSIDGLPSVVRDLHSELSYQLIENENLLDGIEKIDEDKEKIARLKKAIMYVSKYHRQYLPIGENENPSRKGFIDNLKIKIKSLEARLNEDELFKNSKEWKKMIMLAARWLKFIDSTDVQSDRTVMDEYTQIRVQRTKDEIESLCYDFLANNSMLSKLDMTEKILKTLEYLDAQDWKALDNVACEIEDIVYKEIRSNLENVADKKVIFIDEYIKKADRIAFKSRQFQHFEKHQAVKSIMPEFYNPKEETLYIKVYPEKKVPEEKVEDIVKDIKKDINNEFKSSGLQLANEKLKNLAIES
ncbi:hypothetical protein [Athalassotoga saccharophila]|uniref:hypothetical protein n=1 Tax=Athalassotoga saccharophila TaxID=1441386 RepID=UPI00137AD68F|nr:hypothetical protein [Athalassotoga saccharophila]BBJ28681.1 hypothetical protein ATHSA_1600 [Athalassotoga saccharophila]